MGTDDWQGSRRWIYVGCGNLKACNPLIRHVLKNILAVPKRLDKMPPRSKPHLPLGPAYDPLFSEICGLLESARRGVGKAVNSIITVSYWEIGRRIVEEEQKGRRKAAYGEELINQLANDLTERFGRGFSRANVFQMRQFYLAYGKKVQTVSGQGCTTVE